MLKILLLQLIRFYQFALSPWLGNQCRFYPTCSEYAKIAITHHGGIKGGWLAIKRIGRCNPWCEGGFDGVPGVPLNLDGDEDEFLNEDPSRKQ